jgi:flagellar export protein FliJ
MGRFHFPLDRVLRWRSLEFAVEQAKLKRLGQDQIRLQMQAASLGAERSRLSASLAALPDPRGADLGAMVAYGGRLRRLAEKLAERKARCEQELAAQKKKYNEAKQRVQLLEELRERKLHQWRYEQGQALESLAAESYLSVWNRERRNAPAATPNGSPVSGPSRTPVPPTPVES